MARRRGLLSLVNLRRVVRSPTFLSVGVHALAGLGFAGASLVLARILPAREYAVFTLVIALVNFGHALAPFGIDGVVLRRELDRGPRLLARVVAATMTVGLALGLLGSVGYGLAPALDGMVFVSCAAGGAMYVAAARLQREQRYGLSLTLQQSPNLVLILAAAVALGARSTEAWLPLLVSTAGFVAAAGWGWAVLLAERPARAGSEPPFPWREALRFMGLTGSGLLLVQLDRLVIPHLLPLEDLATYGVLAAIVGSLFRVLQMGVAYSLTPRLVAAPSVRARRRLIAAEARVVAALIAVGSAAIWLVTPVVERLLLAGKYHLSEALILAAIAAGVAKSLNAFSTATVTALADPRELGLVNLLGWLSVAVSITGAAVGADWGLAGVVYGVGLGWLLRALAGLALTLRHLRVPQAEAPQRRSM